MTASTREIAPGDQIRYRDINNIWRETIALSPARVDHPNLINRWYPYETVSIQPEGWEDPINWPADDVELAEL